MTYRDSTEPAIKWSTNWKAESNRRTATGALKGSGLTLVFLSPLASSFSHGDSPTLFKLCVVVLAMTAITFLTALFRFITGL